jgi:hypothetical protein
MAGNSDPVRRALSRGGPGRGATCSAQGVSNGAAGREARALDTGPRPLHSDYPPPFPPAGKDTSACAPRAKRPARSLAGLHARPGGERDAFPSRKVVMRPPEVFGCELSTKRDGRLGVVEIVACQEFSVGLSGNQPPRPRWIGLVSRARRPAKEPGARVRARGARARAARCAAGSSCRSRATSWRRTDSRAPPFP